MTDEGQDMAMSAKEPVHGIRFVRLKAAIWENDGASGKWFTATFHRLYKEKGEKGGWKQTSSYRKDDLLLQTKLVDSVHTWMLNASNSAD